MLIFFHCDSMLILRKAIQDTELRYVLHGMTMGLFAGAKRCYWLDFFFLLAKVCSQYGME